MKCDMCGQHKESVRPRKMITIGIASSSVPFRSPAISSSGERSCSNTFTRGTAFSNAASHGETGRGCGASHQTGWTALAVKLLENTIEHSD